MHINRTLSSAFGSSFPRSERSLPGALRSALEAGREPEIRWLMVQAERAGQPMEAATVTTLIELACQTRLPLDIKQGLTRLPGFDPNAATPQGRTPLEIAVSAGDPDFARHLLCLGAEPLPQPDTATGGEMAELLRAGQAIHAIFPPQARERAGRAFALEQALRRYDLTLARNLLEKERARQPDSSDAALWTEATRNRRVDILCAMLALCDPPTIAALSRSDHPTGPTLLSQAMRIGHPELRRYLKQIPYFPDKHLPAFNLNGAACFRNTPMPIYCRHLTTYWLQQRMRSPNNKIDYANLRNPQNIAEHVMPETDIDCRTMRQNAIETHLVDNQDFGHFLAGQFRAMLPAFRLHGQPVKRRMFVGSSNHAMALELKVSGEEGSRPRYAACLYDPNWTNVHKRVSVMNLEIVQQLQLSSFLAKPISEALYYPEPHRLSSVFTVSADDLRDPPAAGTERCLASTTSTLSPAVLYNLLRYGMDGELRARQAEIVAHLRELDATSKVEWLAAKDGNGIPGLHMAMQNGHAIALAAWGEILGQLHIPRPAIAQLLAAKDSGGTTGLCLALMQGHAATIDTVGELMARADLTHAERVELLVALDERHVPGLAFALQEGRSEAVTAFGRLIWQARIRAPERFRLLAAKDTTGTAGLCRAFTNNHGQTIAAFGAVVAAARLRESQTADLLAAKASAGTPGLYLAMRHNKCNAITAFGEVLAQAGLSAETKMHLLAARDRNGFPAAFAAYINQHTHALDAWRGAIVRAGLTGEEQRAFLESLKINE